MSDPDANSGRKAVDRGTQGLRLAKVCVDYGAENILKQIDAIVPEGRLIALAGPNGSGKSTLLSAMARLLKPNSGQVCLDGKSIHRISSRELARHLGILPQNPLLPEAITALDLVSRGRFPHQGVLRQWTPGDDHAIEEAMRLTGTLEFADRQVDQLSGGQRQRCWIAMAIAQETRIMLLDEPTAFLDLRYQIEILDLLHDLSRNHGRTIVVVLHDLNCVMSYADTIFFLKNGALAADPVEPRNCTPELVSEIFDIDVLAATHPQSDRPVFLPVSGRQAGGA
ncbi:ABC transporter ATP-binding protein [Roseibium sp.]|uniref:ABC transporter ATP-binding protein n=1 Tax=Roseibium sp. TaxID=1936156 RepID=UPI003A96DEC8